MAKLSELKIKARELEKLGQTEKALSIYQHILSHLEGTPSINNELALFVKTGDLLLRLGRSDEALSSFQKGAGYYAQFGAAQRVNALCDKIARVDPSRANLQVTYARTLLDGDHLGSARDVLADYAAKAELGPTIEILDELAGRSSEHIRPVLTHFLEAIEKGEPLTVPEEARRASRRLSRISEQEIDPRAEEIDPKEVLGMDWKPADPMAESDFVPEDDVFAFEPVQEWADPESRKGKWSLEKRKAEAEEQARREAEEVAAADAETEVESAAEPDPKEKTIGGVEYLDASASVDDWLSGKSYEETAHEDESPDAGDEAESNEDTETAAGDADPQMGTLSPTGTVSLFTDSGAETDPDSEAEDETDMEPASEVEDGPESEPEPVPVREPKPEPAERTAPRSFSAPTTPRQLAHKPPEPAERKGPSPLLMAGGGVIAGLVIGLGLAVTGVIPIGGASSPTEAPPQTPAAPQAAAPAPTEEPVVAAVADSTDDNQLDTSSVRAADSGAIGVAQLGDSSPPVVSLDSAVSQLPQGDSVPTAVVAPVAPVETTIDTPDMISGDVADTAAGAGEQTPPVGNPVVVDGLEISSVSETVLRGQPGFRVVHLLDSGDEFTIESYPDTLRARDGNIQVVVTPPDTVVGILRMRTHMVYASGVMPEDSLRTLMALLVVADSGQ